ncbi:MAG: hypothetical protein RI575_05270 [Balneolaceae bacterium]|nr:hypothetical protein [Balneolaceae bacterium]
MEHGGSCLGVCYTDNHLFYSVNTPGQVSHLARIGSIDFSFDIEETIITGNPSGFPAFKSSIEELREEFQCKTAKILAPAPEECWTVVPRAVYEDASEREAHIKLLMQGTERQNIQVIWHTLSNPDYRLLLLRDTQILRGFNYLLESFRTVDIVTDFEIALDWQLHTNSSESFLMIHCQKNYISITSFILGKLRGCTNIEYDEFADLPYLWNLYEGNLSWMNGIHDKTYLYGYFSSQVSDRLQSYWYNHGETINMNTLPEMGVDADEKTYGFRLEAAFPAILMSLNRDLEKTEVHENYNG